MIWCLASFVWYDSNCTAFDFLSVSVIVFQTINFQNKNHRLMKWKAKPQEQNGTYRFSGKFLVTNGVMSSLTRQEIEAIYFEIQKLVKEHNGIDYLMVYVHENTGQKLFFSDQLNDEMIASGEFLAEYNYCTLMLASEW